MTDDSDSTLDNSLHDRSPPVAVACLLFFVAQFQGAGQPCETVAQTPGTTLSKASLSVR